MNIDIIKHVVYITDWANICESGYFSKYVNICKYPLNALTGMLYLGIRKKGNANVNTSFHVFWNKYGFTRFTAHNGTHELFNDYLFMISSKLDIRIHHNTPNSVAFLFPNQNVLAPVTAFALANFDGGIGRGIFNVQGV